MFGISFVRWRLGVVFAAVLAAGALAVLTVHASASGAGKVSGSARAQSLRMSGLLKQPSLKGTAALSQLEAGASAHAAAMTATGPTTVSCEEKLTKSTTLSANLYCEGENGLVLDAAGITLNLDGHLIFGTEGQDLGVVADAAKDTVEHGYVIGFFAGVETDGASDVVTGVQADDGYAGFVLKGTANTASDDTASSDHDFGLYLDGSGETAQSDHLLNSQGEGIYSEGSENKLLDNIADGNAHSGIAAGYLSTLTGNVANFNGEYGIDADPPVIDGGSNSATGNGTATQCYGVVCS